MIITDIIRLNPTNIYNGMKLEIYIQSKIIPKARPRFNSRGKAYLPKRYKAWRQKFEALILEQVGKIKLQPPIEKSEIEVIFFGMINGDLDNLVGGVLDSLVATNIILDDSYSCVDSLKIKYDDSVKQTGCRIKITTKNEKQKTQIFP